MKCVQPLSVGEQFAYLGARMKLECSMVSRRWLTKCAKLEEIGDWLPTTMKGYFNYFNS